MKFFPSFLFFIVALNLSLSASNSAAQTASDPLPSAAIAQLLSDLAAVTAGSTVTDAQHQAIFDDLSALAAGVFTPDPDDLNAFADDLGNAAANGLLNADALALLSSDLADIPDNSDDSDDSDSWFTDIQSELDNLLYASIDFPIETLDPPVLDPLIYEFTSVGHRGATVSGAYSARTILLDTQGVQPPLLQHYFGRVQLVDYSFADGVHAVSLSLTAQGLPMGSRYKSSPYLVSITRRSDGANVVLGKLHVKPYFDLSGDVLPPVATNAISATAHPAVTKIIRPRPNAELATYGAVVFGHPYGRKSLPTGFDATDVATITLTDSQGIVRLSGSFADSSSNLRRQVGHLSMRLNGMAMPAAPAPVANVFARHKVTPQITRVFFHLSARHLPNNSMVTLLADGVSLGQFPTTAKGRLVIVDGNASLAHRLSRGGLPVQSLSVAGDLSAARSFALIDAQGNVLASGTLDNDLAVSGGL